MGTAYYPSLEKNIQALKPHLIVDGRALSREWDFINSTAQEVGVKPLEAFVSQSTEEEYGLLGEDIPEGVVQKSPQFFDPELGLKTLTALINKLKSMGSNFEDVILDLQSFENVLEQAKLENVGFRIKMDI